MQSNDEMKKNVAKTIIYRIACDVMWFVFLVLYKVTCQLKFDELMKIKMKTKLATNVSLVIVIINAIIIIEMDVYH
jgi:hypothetical protein